jgi:hypothetical protein
MWAVIPLFDFVSARFGFLGFSAFGFLSLVTPLFFLSSRTGLTRSLILLAPGLCPVNP